MTSGHVTSGATSPGQQVWMGRNERRFDSKAMIQADQAYVTSGGSFRALVISLLTSDSFLYRKVENSASHASR